MRRQNRQKGGSGIGMVITLVILGYGVFIGIQYVPQYIESSNVKMILDSIIDKHNKDPAESAHALQSMIDNQLYINQMEDLKDAFKVTQYRGDFIINVSYERELNLLYTNKKMLHETTITLD